MGQEEKKNLTVDVKNINEKEIEKKPAVKAKPKTKFGRMLGE